MSAGWWTGTWLIARRELYERIHARSFRIVTALLVVAVAAAVVIPSAIGHHRHTQRVGLLGRASPTVYRAAHATGRLAGDRVVLEAVSNMAQARAELHSGQLDAVIVDGREVLIKQRAIGGASSGFADALAQFVGLAEKLPPDRAGAALSGGIALPVRSLEPPPKSLASRFTGLAVALIIYIVIFFYGMRLTQAVGEEKTSRVVEVLLAAVRATQLLTGKVIGFALVALAQLVAMGVAFVICALAVGSQAIHGAASPVGFAVSALLCVAATVATARAAGVVYERSVMRTGARVRLRQVLRPSGGARWGSRRSGA